MQAVILIGLPASGKSTFYHDRFGATHVRLNLDSLRSRKREARILADCLERRVPFVVDNTNASARERARFIVPARASGYEIIAFYFRSVVAECQARNRLREGAARVPDAAILGIAGRLVRPAVAEGFSRIWYVRMDPEHGFLVEEWRDEAE